MQPLGKKIVRTPPSADTTGRFPGLHPVLGRIFALRGIGAPDELTLELSDLLPAEGLGQIDRATALLEQALRERWRILIIADFDADGATSCALAIRALRSMGADHLDYLVPNRFEYGYGLTPEILAEALPRRPDLIITVDNGIASNAGIAAAARAGVPVLVTDHHLPGEQLPDAAAIVNPNVPGDTFASKALAGVGVIFYVMVALRTRLRNRGWFEHQSLSEPNLADLLDLVALGTVADVVPLDRNNRILVHQGIRRIQAGRCCEGIKALLRISGKAIASVVTSDLGFRVGPRLNAAGRLDDMSIGIECLLTDAEQQAHALAGQLNALNGERREIERSMRIDAMAGLTEMFQPATLPAGIVVYREDWHQGVIGILAARIREHFQRPVIAFASAAEGELKGSARSIPGLHIRDTLDLIAKRHPHILEKFGGHAMAAGLTLRQTDLDSFSELFDRAVRERLAVIGLDDVLHSDGPLLPEQLGMELAEAIRHASPWGQHFPEPLFDGLFDIFDQRIVGSDHLKWVLIPDGSEKRIDAIAFNQAARLGQGACTRIHAAYRLDINEYRGMQKEQLIIEYFEPAIIPIRIIGQVPPGVYRNHERSNMHDEEELDYLEDEDEQIVSKSEIKREMLALQALAERLLSLKPQAWEKLDFTPGMMDALRESTRIKSHNAIRRHIRRIAKLLNNEDTEQVRQLFERMDNHHMQDVQAFHRLERWRDRLVEEGDAAVEALLDEYPNADRQHLRQLIRTAQKETLQGKSPASQRKIFKYLKEITDI